MCLHLPWSWEFHTSIPSPERQMLMRVRDPQVLHAASRFLISCTALLSVPLNAPQPFTVLSTCRCGSVLHAVYARLTEKEHSTYGKKGFPCQHHQSRFGPFKAASLNYMEHDPEARKLSTNTPIDSFMTPRYRTIFTAGPRPSGAQSPYLLKGTRVKPSTDQSSACSSLIDDSER